MIELNQDDLKELKKVELEILNEVSRICKKHNLKYSLTGGTLLGAIRHKGFIPWDDDIDIVMPYDDYVLFLEYAKSEMSNKFFVNNIYSDPYFGYLPISKVMAYNTSMVEIPAKKSKAKSGIFIDIFPLYNTSDNDLIRKMEFKIIQRLSKNLRCRNGYKYDMSIAHSFIYNIRSFIYKLIPLSFFIFCFELIVKKDLNNKNSKYIVSYGGIYDIQKETFSRDLFSEYVSLEFEGYKFLSMKLWDPYLKSHYGNYMKLPPVEKRIPHHFLISYQNNFFK